MDLISPALWKTVESNTPRSHVMVELPMHVSIILFAVELVTSIPYTMRSESSQKRV